MARSEPRPTKYLNRYLGWRRSLEALGDGRDQQRWLGAAMGMPSVNN